MLVTGLGVLATRIVQGGVGGLFGTDERRQAAKYLDQQGDQGDGSEPRM